MKKILLCALMLAAGHSFGQAKNVVAKNWEMIACSDAKFHTSTPDGTCSFSAITGTKMLYTDFVAAPTTGGENNKGGYISIFGVNLAANFAALGNSTIVYFCGQPVDNYRVYKPAVGSGTGGLGNGVFETWGVMRLTVQVGALGSPTPGVECKIDIKTNGNSTPINATDGSGFYLDDDGNRISFTPQPGPIVFVDGASGNDANAGTIASPIQHLQDQANTSGAVFTGALYGSGTVGGATQSNVVQPGTQIVLRGGTYTHAAVNPNFSTTWAHTWQLTGTSPNGAASGSPVVVGALSISATANGTGNVCRFTVSSTANFRTNLPITIAGQTGNTECNGTYTATVVNSTTIEAQGTTFVAGTHTGGTVGAQVQAAGPIMITSYPGAAGANAPELAYWEGASSAAGGITNGDSARTELVTPWGFVGFSKWFHIANVRIKSHANTANLGACPINLQAQADWNRIVNTQLEWRSVDIQAQCGGIAGNGANIRIYGNYIHDIYSSIAKENHCIYFDGAIGTVDHRTVDPIVAYNVLKNCLGGNGIQIYDNYTTDGATGFNFHHNWIQNVTNKFGFNLSSNTVSGKLWNNIVVDSLAPMALNTQRTVAIDIVNNTFYGWNNTAYAALYNQAVLGGGSINFQNNIVAQSAGAATGWNFFSNSGGTVTCDSNFWYDYSGFRLVRPTCTTNIGSDQYVDPLFTNKAIYNFTPNGSSTAPNNGATPAVTIPNDNQYVPRPQSPNTKPAVGALERIGG